jgi:hypothetical protein
VYNGCGSRHLQRGDTSSEPLVGVRFPGTERLLV